MTKQGIIDVLENDIKCQEQKVCVTDCEDCQYYITRPKMAEVHKEILKLLSN